MRIGLNSGRRLIRRLVLVINPVSPQIFEVDFRHDHQLMYLKPQDLVHMAPNDRFGVREGTLPEFAKPRRLMMRYEWQSEETAEDTCGSEEQKLGTGLAGILSEHTTLLVVVENVSDYADDFSDDEFMDLHHDDTISRPLSMRQGLPEHVWDMETQTAHIINSQSRVYNLAIRLDDGDDFDLYTFTQISRSKAASAFVWKYTMSIGYFRNKGNSEMSIDVERFLSGVSLHVAMNPLLGAHEKRIGDRKLQFLLERKPIAQDREDMLLRIRNRRLLRSRLRCWKS